MFSDIAYIYMWRNVQDVVRKKYLFFIAPNLIGGVDKCNAYPQTFSTGCPQQLVTW